MRMLYHYSREEFLGDFLIINLLRKENKDDFVEDHPSEAGCYIYRKIKK